MKTKSQSRKNKSKGKTQKRAKNCGGKVVGSGGYGCVFRPALKCKGASGRIPKMVSKLMTKRHTASEYAEISRFLPILQKIPNYQDYFIVEGANTCEPASLTRSDLESFDIKCNALKKDGFTQENINESLNKLDSLNLPDGGMDLGDYINMHSGSPYDLNKSLIRLLVNGIVPMNNYGLYHADIKESNILVDFSREKVRLIDWGLSAKTAGFNIPHVMYDKPFQYNLPFSSILFNDTFKRMYRELCEKYDELEKDPELIRDFLKKYITKWNKSRGQGHLKLITSLWFIISGTEKVTKKIIIPYLTKILMHYTKDGQFLMMDYFREVYLKNIDLWGFIMCYSPFLENKYESGFNYTALSKVFINYLYKTSIHPISVPSLVTDLENVFLINE